MGKPVNGHPFDAENTYVRQRNGHTHRECRTCRNGSFARWQQRQHVLEG